MVIKKGFADEDEGGGAVGEGGGVGGGDGPGAIGDEGGFHGFEFFFVERDGGFFVDGDGGGGFSPWAWDFHGSDFGGEEAG